MRHLQSKLMDIKSAHQLPIKVISKYSTRNCRCKLLALALRGAHNPWGARTRHLVHSPRKSYRQYEMVKVAVQTKTLFRRFWASTIDAVLPHMLVWVIVGEIGLTSNRRHRQSIYDLKIWCSGIQNQIQRCINVVMVYVVWVKYMDIMIV